jgi:hypothetical protein
MKGYRQRRIAGRLETARIATTNASAVPPVLSRLTEFGYNDPKLTQGKSLYAAAVQKVSEATVRLGEHRAATEHLRQCRAKVVCAYQNLAKTARAVFNRDPGALISLGLKGEMPGAQARLLTAANTLFNTSFYTSAMRATLAEHGHSDAKLSQERGKFAELQFATEVQGQCRAAYQQAKEAQRTALRALDEWMARFFKIARVAFAEDPQTLEQFGLVARSGPTKAQREGRRKAAETRRQKRLVNLAA